MKKTIIILITFINFAFGVNMMKYDVFDNTNEIDIVISFDSAYEPDIFQNIDNNTLTVTLKNVISDEKFTNQINSKILSEFYIIPSDNATKIKFNNAKNLKIQALLGKDNFSITLRVTNSAFSQIKIEPERKKSFPDEKNDLALQTLFCILLFFALIIFIILAKKFLFKKNKKDIETTWKIFENLNDKEKRASQILNHENFQQFPFQNYDNKDIKIVFQKPLDDENRVVILEFEHKNYLVILGSTNILLDKFGEDFMHCEKDFQEFFEKNRQRLSSFAHNKQNSLKDYIKKASNDFN